MEEHDDGTVTVRSPLPNEVQFESLATRVRPFTLSSDRLYWVKALDALDRLTDLSDMALRLTSRDLRDEWMQATDRTTRARAFHSGYEIADGSGVRGHFTDIDLAYAWLYQDVAHVDAVSTGPLDVTDRYHAAVSVFANTAVVAIETLHYINELVELGVVALPVGTFSDPVVVTASERVVSGLSLIETEPGNDLTDPAIEASVPGNLRPAMGLIRHMVQRRSGDPQSQVVSMQIQRAQRSSS
jgi:hypothetical protein